jgi:hypothetical protein
VEGGRNGGEGAVPVVIPWGNIQWYHSSHDTNDTASQNSNLYVSKKIKKKIIDIRKICVYVIYNLLEPISKYTLKNKKDKLLCE